MKSVVGTCACANSLDHLDFRLFIFGSHSRNQDEFTVSFILRRKFIFLFFKKAVRILSLCEYYWPCGLQPWCTEGILFKDQISFPSMKAVVGTFPYKFSFPWPFGFQIVYLWPLQVLTAEVHLPVFRESCSNCELMRIFLTIWIAAMVHCQYFI